MSPRQIAVRRELVLEHMVGRIVDRARAIGRPGEEAEAHIAALAEMVGPEEAVRLGYLARDAERELFEPARSPSGRLAGIVPSRLAGSSDPGRELVRMAAELARGEPERRPDPDDARAVTWQVPGPGGHVRHEVALATCPAGTDPPEWRRAFVAGFVLRSCEEVAARAG